MLSRTLKFQPEPVDAPDPIRPEESSNLPDARQWLASIVVPEIPWEVPTAESVLEQFALTTIDPWHIPGLDPETSPAETPR